MDEPTSATELVALKLGHSVDRKTYSNLNSCDAEPANPLQPPLDAPTEIQNLHEGLRKSSRDKKMPTKLKNKICNTV